MLILLEKSLARLARGWRHSWLALTLAGLFLALLSGCGAQTRGGALQPPAVGIPGAETPAQEPDADAADPLNSRFDLERPTPDPYLSPLQTTGHGARISLAVVETWISVIGADVSEALIESIAASSYQLVVIDFIPSLKGSENYPIAGAVQRMQDGGRLVFAYLDVGEVEDYRTYWQPQWRIGDPAWILGEDPDGWAGNYPAAYWEAGFQALWPRILEQVAAAGFDGVYLDWVGGHADEQVQQAAKLAGLDPVAAMADWVAQLAWLLRSQDPSLLIIAQNPGELITQLGFGELVDAIAQEHLWFDGGQGNHPPGDCPLPASEEDVGTPAYLAALPPACLLSYLREPHGSLHSCSRQIIDQLAAAGLPIFTIDYALDPRNVTWIMRESRSYGFIPFVGGRQLDRYVGQ